MLKMTPAIAAVSIAAMLTSMTEPASAGSVVNRAIGIGIAAGVIGAIVAGAATSAPRPAARAPRPSRPASAPVARPRRENVEPAVYEIDEKATIINATNASRSMPGGAGGGSVGGGSVSVGSTAGGGSVGGGSASSGSAGSGAATLAAGNAPVNDPFGGVKTVKETPSRN